MNVRLLSLFLILIALMSFLASIFIILSNFLQPHPLTSSDCYFSACEGQCVNIKFKANEECPFPPLDNLENRVNVQCSVVSDKCVTIVND